MDDRHTHSIRRRSVIVALLTCVGLLALSPAAPAAASAAEKRTICHATGSATNPYVEITINERAVAAHQAHQDGKDLMTVPAGGCPGTVPPPIDVCPNLLGDQAEVPEGFELDPMGNCVPVIDPPFPFIPCRG